MIKYGLLKKNTKVPIAIFQCISVFDLLATLISSLQFSCGDHDG